jgi:hypothetical protein
MPFPAFRFPLFVKEARRQSRVPPFVKEARRQFRVPPFAKGG